MSHGIRSEIAMPTELQPISRIRVLVLSFLAPTSRTPGRITGDHDSSHLGPLLHRMRIGHGRTPQLGLTRLPQLEGLIDILPSLDHL
jgi:hypothetical protein